MLLKPLKVEKNPGTIHLKLVCLAKMHRILSFLWPHSLEFTGLCVLWDEHTFPFSLCSFLWTHFTYRKCVAVLYLSLFNHWEWNLSKETVWKKTKLRDCIKYNLMAHISSNGIMMSQSTSGHVYHNNLKRLNYTLMRYEFL